MKLKYISLLVIIFLGCTNLNAQLKLIPTPREITIEDSYFIFNQEIKIVNKTTNDFYTQEINQCLEQELNIKLSSSKNANTNFIEIAKINSHKELKKTLKNNELNIDFNLGQEGYILKITPEFIKIISKTNAGIYYGIQTLKQLITANRIKNSIPCLVIYDSPDFPIRAWQDDISRGPIPTMDYLKKQIKKMSSYKLNYFTMYTEHVFKLKKHSDIAPEDGITKEDIKELSDYAHKYHVTLIGNYQSFGHMEKTLAHPNYQHLAENGHIISPALDESYEFLSDVYEEIVPAYSGEFFNINCDETFGLGEEKSKQLVDSIGIEEVYVSHINKLDSLLDPYDKSILMWGDIAGNHPKIVSSLPKDITVMVWGYHAADNFDDVITPISNTGLNFWVAPGVNCWRNIFPNLKAAKINIFNFIRDSYKHKASGVLNTTWDDDGLNFFENNWHGLAWGAENSWNCPSVNLTKEASELERETRYSNFNLAFDEIFFGLDDEQLTNQIVKFSELHQSTIRAVESNGRFFEQVFPIHFDYVQDGKREENLKVLYFTDSLSDYISTIKPKVRNNQLAIKYLQYAVRQVKFTVLKNLLRIDIYNYMQGDTTIVESELTKEIDKLVAELQYLKSQYQVLWNYESKDWWLSRNMDKFNKLQNSIEGLKGYCIITPHDSLTDKGREITLHSLFSNLPVYYTIDDNSNTPVWKRYEEPLYFDKDVKISAKVIHDNIEYSAVEDSLIFHKGIGKLHKLNSNFSTYHPSYNGGGNMALLDGKLGNPDELRSGRWQGFSGQNIELEIDMEKQQPIKSFSMGFYQNTFSWVIFPRKIEIFFKNDINEDYILLETITNTIPPEEKGSLKYTYSAGFQDFSARHLKIVAHYYGKLPEWHHAGSSYESMIFADEIILEEE